MPAPVITSPLTATATVGQPFSYQIVATNSPTSYSIPGMPNGLTFNTTTGLLSGTITGIGQTGTSYLPLTATNASGSDTENLFLTVLAAAPVMPLAAQSELITSQAGMISSVVSALTAYVAAPRNDAAVAIELLKLKVFAFANSQGIVFDSSRAASADQAQAQSITQINAILNAYAATPQPSSLVVIYGIYEQVMAFQRALGM